MKKYGFRLVFRRRKRKIASIIEIQFSLSEIPQTVGRFSIVGTVFLVQSSILARKMLLIYWN